MFSTFTVIISFLLVFCLPITSEKVTCKDGEKIYEENLIYDCVDGKKVYYGCLIDGIEYRRNTTKDENNLRRHLCYKDLNDVKPIIVIGCVTDDNIFINETKTIQQIDGSTFTCIKKVKGYTFTKSPSPPPKPHGCKLGKTKTISRRFLLECKRKNQTHNYYSLVACYPIRENHKLQVKTGKSYDDIINKEKGYGFRYRCHTKSAHYFYDLVGCLVGHEFIKPDDIFLNESIAVLCLQEGADKLRLKPFTHNKFVGKCLKDEEGLKPAKKVVKLSFHANLNNKNDVQKCSDSWTLNGGFCYKVFNQQSTWKEAKERCESENSALASVHGLDEAKFIANLAYSPEAETWFWKTQAWIGLYNTDTNADWKWVDNTPFSYRKWGINEPDDVARQKCGYIRITASKEMMIADTGDFQNTVCDESLAKFVCKKAASL